MDRFCSAGDHPEAAPRTLLIVAHPDDEAIGAGARLASLPGVVVVHVTDGSPRDAAYAQARGFPSREAYAQARHDEVVAALGIAGIPPQNVRSLGLVDGETSENLVELSSRLASLIGDLSPEIVLTHPYEGGHSDHDATAFGVHLACGMLKRDGIEPPVILELTSYNAASGEKRVNSFIPHEGVEMREIQLTEDMRELKRRMYDSFATQRSLLRSFPLEAERFRPAPRYVFTRPPHPGPLNYERFCQLITGAEWRHRAMRALDQLRAKWALSPRK